jgi:predicted transcriptional regulator
MEKVIDKNKVYKLYKRRIIMDEKKLIVISRIVFAIGILLICTAVFVDTVKVACVSTVRTERTRFNIELSEKYVVEAPVRPLDESRFILAPEKPAYNATNTVKEAYEKVKSEHDEKVKLLKEEYKKANEEYNSAYKKYRREQKETNFVKAKERRENDDIKKDFKEKIKMRELSINDFLFSTIFRFLGSIIFILGSLGMLIWGENYERIGVLIAIGFGLKTIIGL